MALGLASCSSDEPKGPEGQVAEKDEVRFLRVALANTPGSRAAKFEDGTEAENTVNSMYFLFYDVNGNPIPNESFITDITDKTFTDKPGNGNVDAFKEMIVQVKIARGQQYPSYVVAFLNPVNWDVDVEKATMEELRDLLRSSYRGGNDFAMTNSVYFGKDPITGSSNVKMSGAPIKLSQLYTSEQDAEDATGEGIVDIYVERYAAKVQFSLDENAIADYTVGDYSLTFAPEKFSVNAAAPTMYAVKRYADNNAATTGIPTYVDVQTMLGTWTSWNEPTNFRSYWACSPSFYAEEFPQVSDDIIEKAPKGTTGAGEAIEPYALQYFSYNQISASTGIGAGLNVVAGTPSQPKYALENTMGKAAFASLNPKAAAPSVVLVGHYSVKKGETEITVGEEGFSLYKDKLYYNGTVPAADAGGVTLMTALLNENEILATSQTEDVNGNVPMLNANSLTTTHELANYFEIVHPAKAVRGNQPVPHRYVTLQLKSGLANYTGLYFKQNGTGEWAEVTADDVTLINTSLWQQIGVASCYTNSKCYFSIPIQHLGYTENTDNPPLTDGLLDWAKVRVGDFGLVRNHVYTINVTEIKGRADGIHGLDNPLVPSMEENDYWVKYRINILNWRVVPTQKVTL